MKTLMIRDDVYKKLKSIKQKNESFSDVIDRLIRQADNRVKLEKFFGILSEKEAEIMTNEILELRRRLSDSFKSKISNATEKLDK